jgi:hypothetical protein
MQVRSRIARVVVAATTAAFVLLTALGVFVWLPIWLLAQSEPWELRSTNDHLTADLVTLGAVLLALVVSPALVKIAYIALSPATALQTDAEKG